MNGSPNELDQRRGGFPVRSLLPSVVADRTGRSTHSSRDDLIRELEEEGNASAAANREGVAMGRTIAVCTQKGGVGKTTTVANLACAWGQQGTRVLAVDFDPQFALTRRFGVSPAGRATVDTVFREGRDLADVISAEVAEGVDLVPSERGLSAIELSLAAERKREYFLSRALAPVVDGYDVVLVDCPPNLGLLTVNALCACREVLVPIDMEDVDALHGAEELVALVRELADTGDDVRLLGLLRVVVDRRRQVYNAIATELEQSGLPVLDTEIPDSVDFQKSAVVHEPLMTWQPDSAGASAYRRLSEELGVLAMTATSGAL
jgi:chromosome partitioning protein